MTELRPLTDAERDILRLHGAWLRGEYAGARARLAGADLAGADLEGARLAGADLEGANLTGANLADANLMGANLADARLAGAGLTGADLEGANLARASLAGANLTGANLTNTCLNPPPAWEWVQINAIFADAIDGRTLVVARRSRTSLHVGSQDYSEPGVYRAAVWSADITVECHPGLYLTGNTGDVLCAAWLDESIAVEKGLRCRRFRRLVTDDDAAIAAEVATWGADALDGGVTVHGWTAREEVIL